MTVVRSQWSGVSKSVFGITLCAMLLALCFAASAQQPKKVPRAGDLTVATSDGQSAPKQRWRGWLEPASVVCTAGDQRLRDDAPAARSFSITQRRINVASRTRLVLATRLTALASLGRNRTVTAVLDPRVNTGAVISSSWSSKSVRSWLSQNRASSSIESVEGILGAFIVFSIG